MSFAMNSTSNNNYRILTEGADFEKWRSFVDAILRAHDLPDHQYACAEKQDFKNVYQDAQATDLDFKIKRQQALSARVDENSHVKDLPSCELCESLVDCAQLLQIRRARPGKAASILLRQVEPGLRSRIAAEHTDQPFSLWKALRDQSKPFRFMDLPAELQNRVVANLLGPKPKSIAAHQPPITRVCRQLRKETLPTYYSCTAFYVHPRGSDSKLYGDAKTFGGAVEKYMGKWCETQVKDMSKHLRDITLVLTYTQRKGPIKKKNIHFTFSKARGLAMTWDDTLKAPAHLEAYAATVESTRRMLGMTGDAIILGLVKDTKLWDANGLEWKS